jgi:hypothetical protein
MDRDEDHQRPGQEVGGTVTAAQAQLLRDVVDPHQTSVDRRAASAEKLLVDDESLPSGVVESLSTFIGDTQRLADVQLAVVDARSWNIGVEFFAELVAHLALTVRALSLAKAAGALSSIPFPERSNLSPDASRATDVADAVTEDASDGVMAVDDDDILRDALTPLAARAQP